jgi:hypothetical protein
VCLGHQGRKRKQRGMKMERWKEILGHAIVSVRNVYFYTAIGTYTVAIFCFIFNFIFPSFLV